ncbi:unnamed protein product [Protopolystoma xenopodis]|uniref:Uncharacterized protein n=1 Tax=Protopolystoma xenopodis TaxID=117903 RepID=A0A448XLW3_9PLAT|nr:unnamed protein product [Protopolystoma xenopodis]
MGSCVESVGNLAQQSANPTQVSPVLSTSGPSGLALQSFGSTAPHRKSVSLLASGVSLLESGAGYRSYQDAKNLAFTRMRPRSLCLGTEVLRTAYVITAMRYKRPAIATAPSRGNASPPCKQSTCLHAGGRQ